MTVRLRRDGATALATYVLALVAADRDDATVVSGDSGHGVAQTVRRNQLSGLFVCLFVYLRPFIQARLAWHLFFFSIGDSEPNFTET